MHRSVLPEEGSYSQANQAEAVLAVRAEQEGRRQRFFSWESITRSASFLVSFAFHFALILILALFTIAELPSKQVELVVIEPENEELERPLEFELDESEKIATEMTIANLSISEQGLEGMVESSVSAPSLELPPSEYLDGPEVTLEVNSLLTKTTDSLLEEVPVGTVARFKLSWVTTKRQWIRFRRN